MPVTLVVAPHIAAETVEIPPRSRVGMYRAHGRGPETALDILRGCDPNGLGSTTNKVVVNLIQSSVDEAHVPSILPRSNGFVDTCVLAYNHHHNLVIRPDDVWCAILAQFNLYVNGHAEQMREWFVAHEGKRELEIVTNGSSHTVDWGWLAETMGGLIKDNVTDPDLHSWIMPSFTTSTTTDTTIASIIMMSTLKSYFSYKFSLACGIPSVTLQGEISDWQDILRRVSKFSTINSKGQHPELSAWQAMLEPILHRFIQTFEHCSSPDRHGDDSSIVDFWSKICDERSFGSGPRYLSGWITAFCVFSGDKNTLGRWQGECVQPRGSSSCQHEFLTLDSAMYPLVDTNDVPPGWAEVSVIVNDNGRKYPGRMIAGNVGARAVMEHEGTGANLGDTVQPYQAWFMVDMKEEEKIDETVYPRGEVRWVPPYRPGGFQ